mmetsp:Transcript_6180/g.10394  ORF Transcript_6180/g.10394 Transcript_6180/m.10394 type:complete len:92 (-) Transcript_6180:271-546(-)
MYVVLDASRSTWPPSVPWDCSTAAAAAAAGAGVGAGSAPPADSATDSSPPLVAFPNNVPAVPSDCEAAAIDGADFPTDGEWMAAVATCSIG